MTNLREKQLRAYHDQGFVIVEHFFDDREVAAMLAELERLKAANAGRNLVTPDGKAPATAVNFQINPLSPVSPLFRALPFQRKIIDPVTQCIGQPIVRQLDQIFVKPARHGVGTKWHQDNAYFNISDPTKAVGLWTALHDASHANGTLEVIPRSHKCALTHERDLGAEHLVHCVVDESLAVPVDVRAGGAVFFNYGIAHRTGPNHTDRDRAGLALHFLRTDFIRPDKNPLNYVHLTGAGATKGVREYGEDLSDAWPREIAKLLDQH